MNTETENVTEEEWIHIRGFRKINDKSFIVSDFDVLITDIPDCRKATESEIKELYKYLKNETLLDEKLIKYIELIKNI